MPPENTLQLDDLTTRLLDSFEARYGDRLPKQTAQLEQTAPPASEDPMDVLARWAEEQQDAPTVVMRQRDGKWSATDPLDVVAGVRDAQMEQSLTAAIEKPLNGLVSGIDLGSIAVGGGAGLVLAEIIDGFLPIRPNATDDLFKNVAVKGLAAYGIHQYGSRAMSRSAQRAAITVLLLQAASDATPLNVWISKGLHKLAPGTFPAPMEQEMRQITGGNPPMFNQPITGAGATQDPLRTIF